MRLHSAYAPVKEAERYLSDIPGLDSGSPIVLFTGPGYGYLYDALKKIRPNAEAVMFFHSEEQRQVFTARMIAEEIPIPPCWSPAEPGTPNEFLSRFVQEWDTGRILLVEWPPAIRSVSPEIHGHLVRAVVRGLEHLKANLMATGEFGRRWLFNTLTNLSRFRGSFYSDPERAPVVIAASGPTLNTAIPWIIQNRSKFRLWALPSSLKALDHNGIKPDLAVSTDPGWWASLHYRNLPPDLPIALALSGYPLTQEMGKDRNIILFGQNQFWDNRIISGLEDPLPSIASHGTVAGSALYLAKATGASEIVFTGLDFTFRDIQAHARPHPFELYEWMGTCRTKPLEGALSFRAWKQAPERLFGDNINRERTGPTLRSYAEWFMDPRKTGNIAGVPGRAFPSGVRLSGCRALPESYGEQWTECREPPVFRPSGSGPALKRPAYTALAELWGESLHTLYDCDLQTTDGRDRFFSSAAFSDILYPMETTRIIRLIREIRTGRYHEASVQARQALFSARECLKTIKVRYGG